MLQINGLTYRIGGRTLFQNASARVAMGHRVGLVGKNGSGKSTLLHLILGDLQPDDGSLTVRPSARIGIVSQEAPSGPVSLLDTVLAADKERLALLEESETASDPHRIAEIHTRLADIEAHSAPARAASILAGLGFNETAQSATVDSFSGGWRMRVALAAILFAQPDLLLLDEPTNHLDLEAALWLENYLKRYPGTLLLVSHDRDFLNRVVTGILHLENQNLTTYSGGYDRFERVRLERLTHQSALAARQVAQRQRMQAFIDRFRAKATKARQAQSRLKALARMEPIAAVVEERSASFSFPQPAPLPPPLVNVEDGAVGYQANSPVLSQLNLRIDMDDRIALLGANGNGKSTLARLLSNRLQAQSGVLTKARKLRVGYFAQHQMEELEPGDTAFHHLARMMPGAPESKIRARLGQFGFTQAKADVEVSSLSGGEKARLLFSLMSHAAPQIMILDEPTNHLDVDARENLVQAINDYDGAVILISHDRHLVELCADRLWLVADGTVQPFEGDLDDYANLVLARRREARKAQQASDTKKVNRRDDRRARAEARQKQAHLRKAIQSATNRIEKLTKDKASVGEQLADPELYEGRSKDLANLMKKQSDITQALAEAETEWLQAEHALEEALGLKSDTI